MIPLADIQLSDLAIATGVGLVAVFLGGAIVGAILGRVSPPVHEADEHPRDGGIPGAGRYIGWLERGLIYTCVVTGLPGAAAIVIAVKTAARFPRFERDDRFVEYYLIGTLTSLAIALGAALVTIELVG